MSCLHARINHLF